ncbi:MAG: fructosamine kinase family protein [Myxococcota bacterium]
MSPEVREALAVALGEELGPARSVSGGDINDAWAARCGGETVFVKTRPGAPGSTFRVEAMGLRWLAARGPLRVPEVLAFSEDPPFLALEMIEAGRRAPDFDDALGRGLAALHRNAADQFGLDHDNFIARLPQDNTPTETWAEFYWERRLRPQVELAQRAGLVSSSMATDFERLAARLPERCGPVEPPAPLHGDLWSGNLIVDEAGTPVLIDPAAYAGHREVDLAMMQLFGGFGPRVFATYHEAYPLDSEWKQRVPLYQLYPLLVHVNLFGGSYVGGVQRALHAML